MKRRSLRIRLLLGLMILTISALTGQREIIAFERMGLQGALPDASVVFEDSDGYIWLGSHDGLYRYDGSTYSTFRYDPDDPASVSGNRINCLMEDRLGRIWVGTFGYGLNISGRQKMNFTQVELDIPVGEDHPLNILDLQEDVGGNIWMASDSGVYILNAYDSSSLTTLHVSDLKSLGGPASQDLVRATITADSSGRIWMGTTNGLYMYDLPEKRWYTPSDFNSIGDNRVYDIECDNSNRVWLSTQGSLRMWVYNETTEKFLPYPNIPFKFSSAAIKFCFDKDGRIWAAEFGNALLGYDVENDKLFLNSRVNSNAQYLRFWRTPFTDAAGNVWICSDGVFKYPYPQGFKKYIFDFNADNSVSAIHYDSLNMWVGLRETGLLKYNLSTYETSLISLDDGLYSNLIYSIIAIDAQTMILGEYGAVQVYRDGKFVYTTSVPGAIRHLFRDDNGLIWATGNTGMFTIDIDKKETTRVDLSASLGKRSQFLQTMVPDSEGMLWVGTEAKGLIRFDPATRDIIQLHPGHPEHPLPSWRVNDLASGKGDILWVGTDVGLIELNTRDFSWKLYNHRDGFTQDFIASVICNPGSGVWVSTNKGISHLNTTDGQISNYGTAQGLLNVFYYPRARARGHNGTILFGGRRGVDYFDPANIRPNPFPPRITITSIEISGQDTLDPLLTDLSQGLSFPYSTDLIKIDFQALYHSAPDAVTYQYQIDGLSGEWYDLGNRSEITLTGMSPDDYTVRIRAVSPDGIRDARDVIIPITITPPFWKTVWFRVAILLFIGMTVLYWVNRRERVITRKCREETDLQKKMLDLEKKALLAQMNPHFIFNAMNSIQEYIFDGDNEGAMKYLTKFSRLLRKVIQVSSNQHIALSSEVQLIRDYIELEQMRFPERFDYDIYVDPEIDINSAEISPFIIQPQVENAILHGLLNKSGKGRIDISIEKYDNGLKVSVTDNGIGREKASELRLANKFKHTGRATSIVKQRLMHNEDINGRKPFIINDLYDEHGAPIGTTVEMLISTH